MADEAKINQFQKMLDDKIKQANNLQNRISDLERKS